MEELNRCIRKASEYAQRICGVVDEEGIVLACSDEARINLEDQQARAMLRAGKEFEISEDICYHRIEDSYGTHYACFIVGTDETAQACLHLYASWMEELLRDGGAELTRETLLKNILLENELPGDIPMKSREYRIPYAVRRTALAIHLKSPQPADSIRLLREWVPSRADFVLSLDESNLVILKEITKDSRQETDALARQVLEAFAAAGREDVTIGIGMVADTLKDCSKSYREASLALTVGNIFDPDSLVVHYDRLGLGRLIYQLPGTLCEMFLEEVFPHQAYDSLDAETLVTINKFFENNLNGSETARQLFVHRNTLVYRLDKVMKITNLDLRNFDDAVLFKLASMVRKYLERQDPVQNSMAPRWWKN